MGFPFNHLPKATITRVTLGAVLLLCAGGTAGLMYFQSLLKPVDPGTSCSIRVEIPDSIASGDIGALLAEHGVIRDARAFGLYTRYKGLDNALQAGEYDLSPGKSVPEIIQDLVSGRATLYRFTIPEGYNTAQIAELLDAEGFVDREKFLSVVAGHDFGFAPVDGVPRDERRLEGFLFPETYSVRKGTSVVEIADVMLKHFDAVATAIDLERGAQRQGLSVREAVILASMIEREAQVDDERAVISGVLHNRLRIGMPLQVDATVLYALGKTSSEQVTYQDLEVQSPYNTYKVVGLTPGPIANPGRASLVAAIKPADVPYYYYVAKPDGSHAFAITLAEHNANINRYRR